MAITGLEIANKLKGREFGSFGELEKAITEIFRENVKGLPRGYSAREFIRYMKTLGWLETTEDKVLVST